ncbi:MAG: hypothetical protein IKN38_02280, partial [Clostridia bacterium]|nr:hypothetical protein [Clostridia bacterium]
TSEMVDRAVVEWLTRGSLDYEIRVKPLLLWLMRNEEVDASVMIALDGAFSYKEYKKFAPGTTDEVFKDYLDRYITLGCKRFIFAHKHPERRFKPSPDDVMITERLSDFCRKAGCELIEHYIVTDCDAAGFMESGDEKRKDKNYE